MMQRYDIINTLIKKNNYKCYLEIGLDRGQTFKEINIDKKVSVDPAENEYAHSKPTHLMTSDDFFAQNKDKFDIIFIDGLHHADQVYRDIINSLKSINPGGAVVCHDMNPTKEEYQMVPRRQKIWTGDCWKALVEFRREQQPYKVRVVNTDWGVGIIEESGVNDNLVVTQDLTFKNFTKYKNEWLNLISVEEFKCLYEQ